MNQFIPNQQPQQPQQNGLFSAPAPAGGAKPKRQEVIANVGGHNAAAFSGYGPRTSFFIDGIKVLRPKKGQIFIGRILPARDHTLSPDNPAYLTSVLPYRMPVTPESADPLGDFTGWFNAFYAYKMLGMGTHKIDTTSFKTRAAYGAQADTSDPIMDARNFVYAQLRANTMNQGQVEYLCKRVGNMQTGRPAMLPREQLHYKLNAWGAMFDTQARTYGPPEHGVYLLTGPGFEKLTERLKKRLIAGMQPIDPVFQTMLYGDPTSPQYGLRVWSDLQKHGEVDCGTLVMSSDDDNPQATMSAMSLIGDGLPELLATRSTPALNQFSFMTYDEIYQFMINDNKDPLFQSVMQAACAHAANVGANMATGINNGGFPQQQAPTGFPQQQAPTGFPQQQAPTGFPQQQAPAGFPAQQAPAGFPQQQAPAGFQQQQAPAAFNPTPPTPIQAAAATYMVGAQSLGRVMETPLTYEQIAELAKTTSDLMYLDPRTNQWTPVSSLIVNAPVGNTTIEANALQALAANAAATQQPTVTQQPATAPDNQPWTAEDEAGLKAMEARLSDTNTGAAMDHATVVQYAALVKRRNAALAAASK